MPLSETILVIMGLLAVAMIAAGLCRNLPIPFTVFLVVVGMGLAWLGEHVAPLEPLQHFSLTPDLVFFVFLPALIFESALNLDARQLIKDLAPILALAIPALLVATAIIGVGVWYGLGLELGIALLFGALIAATDPVAVVALFKELGAPARLTILVEGESLFNDATAIVLVHILLAIVLAGGFASAEFWPAVGEFVRVFLGGALVGALIGFGISELMRRLHSSNLAILVMSLVMAYSSFVIAEHELHVSGVMAAVGAAIAMGVYGVSRIPQTALAMVRETWEVIALVCNSLLFLMVGLTVDIGALAANLPAIAVAALLVIGARGAAVYSLVPMATRVFSVPKISMGDRHIMWWGGLKGGLAIAIVLSLPETLADKQYLVELTLGVVLFTLLVNAPTIRPLISLLGIDKLTDDEQSELERGLANARFKAREVLGQLQQTGLLSGEVYSDIEAKVDTAFTSDAVEVDAAEGLRRAYLEALRIEFDSLDRLYSIGLIQEYTYLDLRTVLRRDREVWAGQATSTASASPSNPFLRLENTILRRLREVNWCAPILAKYQSLRLSQRLQRDIAGIVTCQSVLDALADEQEIGADHRDAVLLIYQERTNRRKDRVLTVRREFPDFYASFERRFFQQAALINAKHEMEDEHHHGKLGSKAFGRIEHQIERALEALPAVGAAAPATDISDLLKKVPLFEDLSAQVLSELASRAQQVTFLPHDVVIGEGERGNAMYFITQGEVSVFRKADGTDQPLASLKVGQFFGEAALLEDDVRTATVEATTPSTLLRLTRRDINAVAEAVPEFEQRLHSVHAQRKGSADA